MKRRLIKYEDQMNCLVYQQFLKIIIEKVY